MADPLTVLGAIASSIQIIDVLTKATLILDTLRAQWQSSDIALLSLTSQLGALSAALSKIQDWMQSGVEEVHHQLVMDLNTSINCCKMLATKLYSEISDLQKAPGGSLLTTAKARFVFKRSGIGELQSMVDRQIAALTLLLTACNSKSLSKQQEILQTSGARKRMDRVHEDTESLRGTLGSSSFLSRSTEGGSRLSMMFDFDEQLFSSKSYKAMIRKTVKLSIRATSKNAPGPEEVVTSISSDAVGSTSPTAPLLRNMDQQDLSRRTRLEPTKIVLLGQGESSKTTFVKQMQWIYGTGFPTDEREMWRAIIYDNLATKFEDVVNTYAEHQPEGNHLDDLWYRIQLIQQSLSEQREQLDPAFPYFLRHLMEQTASVARSTGAARSLPDNIEYFVEHLDRICQPNYMPTSDDIFHARTRTTGIHKYTFNVSDHGSCQVYDFGGERSERKKWVKLYGQSAVVLLFVPLDSYDQVLYEDGNTNRIHEAFMLVESLLNFTKFGMESKIFLCLTRYDLFEEKIRSGLSPLNNYLPSYVGPPTDVIQSAQYIIGRFTELLRQRSELGVFQINATDTEHVRDVVETVLSDERSRSPRYYHFEKRVDSPPMNGNEEGSPAVLRPGEALDLHAVNTGITIGI